MGADYQARQIYDAQIKDVTTSADKWKSILKLAGNLYRYEFDNILLIHAQRPHSTLVTDYDTWKKVDRYVMRGSKGIAIFPSRALNPHLRYVFDISDTGGRNRKLGALLGQGYTYEEAMNKLSGITLEGVVISERTAKAVQQLSALGKLDIKDFPLIMHINELLFENKRVNVPWKAFETEYEG